LPQNKGYKRIWLVAFIWLAADWLQLLQMQRSIYEDPKYKIRNTKLSKIVLSDLSKLSRELDRGDGSEKGRMCLP